MDYNVWIATGERAMMDGQAKAHARDDSVGFLGQGGNEYREFEYIPGLSPTSLTNGRFIVVTVTAGARERVT